MYLLMNWLNSSERPYIQSYLVSQICLNEEKDTLGGKKREVKHEEELRSKHGYNQNTE